MNIKVRADGTVKVLDFGLAKARAPEGAGATADPLNSSGVIVFAPDPSGPLYQVPAGGGTPTPATKLADGLSTSRTRRAGCRCTSGRSPSQVGRFRCHGTAFTGSGGGRVTDARSSSPISRAPGRPSSPKASRRFSWRNGTRNGTRRKRLQNPLRRIPDKLSRWHRTTSLRNGSSRALRNRV